MASIRNLKKDINYVLGDIIDAALIWELTNTDKDTQQSQAIVDLCIQYYDELINKVNQKNVENKKQHFRAINQELEAKAQELIDKINALYLSRGFFFR